MKTYKIITLAIFSAFALSQCTPKTTEGMTKASDEVMEVAEVVVEKVTDPALAWRSSAPGAGPARKIQLGEYNTFTMPNGLEVIVVENNKLPRVSYSMTLKNNPVIEGMQAGYVSIAGDLLSTGTTTKTKAEIDSEVDFIGAQISSYSGGIYASSLTKHKAALLDLASDILYNPVFNEDEFEKLKTQYISGIQTEKTDPNSMAGNVANVLNYGRNHPYGEVQTEETIQNVKLETCKKYYNDFFKPNNAYLIIVGDVSLEEAKKDAEKYFGSWAKGDVPSNDYGLPATPNERKVSFVNKEAAVQSVINVTYPIDLKPGSDDAIAASLMNSILGGGIFSGRLMQNLREDKAYTYGARSRLSTDPLVGEFNAFASVRNEVTDSSVTEFIFELNRMITEPVSADDLQLAKNSNAGAFARSLESPQTLARYALNIVKYDLPADYYETYLEKLEAVSVADISAMAKKYIRPENANIVVVGSKDDVAEKLKQFDADGVIDYYDAFGKKVENVAVVPTDIDAKGVLDKYINAISKGQGLDDLNSIHQTYTMSMMGQNVDIDLYIKDRQKMAMKMQMNGNVMMEQKFDGMKASMSGMGQNNVEEEGPMFDQMKGQVQIIEQRFYDENGFTTELKGIEEIDGQQVYKIGVVSPKDVKHTEFYSVETGYLVRTVKVDPESGVTSMTTLSDYKELEGYIFPMKIVTTGGGSPAPIEMIGKAVKINPELSDDMFTIE